MHANKQECCVHRLVIEVNVMVFFMTADVEATPMPSCEIDG